MSATSDPTAAFAEVARRFCGLLDQPLKADELAVAMADLAAAAERLPDVDPGSDAVEVNDVGANDVTLSGLPFDIYWMMFDPLEMVREEPVAGSLADDLLDIRRDLLRGLSLMDAGYPLAACWEWRFHYGAHWGSHLMNAQVALLTYRFR